MVIVTNQSGIVRGYFTENDFLAVQARLDTLLGPSRSTRPEPDKATNRRKPSPSCCLEAARDLDLDLGASINIGDKQSDIEAGLNAGLRGAIWIGESAKAGGIVGDQKGMASSESRVGCQRGLAVSRGDPR